MSEGSGFLSRWARRKAAAQRLEASVPAAESRQKGPDQGADQGPIEPLEDLPPLDTLGTESDYTVFLRAGVSRAVQTQALAIAWASDPRIAGFRGMAEYDWDFNAVGYGRLGAQDDVAVLLRRVVATRREQETLPPESSPAPPDPAGPPPSGPAPSVALEPAVAETRMAPEVRAASASVAARDREPDQLAAAEASAPNTLAASGRSLPRHGGALPS